MAIIVFTLNGPVTVNVVSVVVVVNIQTCLLLHSFNDSRNTFL